MAYRFASEVLELMVIKYLSAAGFALAMGWNRLNADDPLDSMMDFCALDSVVFFLPLAFQHTDWLNMMLMRVSRFHQTDEQSKTCTLAQDSKRWYDLFIWVPNRTAFIIFHNLPVKYANKCRSRCSPSTCIAHCRLDYSYFFICLLLSQF